MSDEGWFERQQKRDEREAEERRRQGELDEEWGAYQDDIARRKAQGNRSAPVIYGPRKESSPWFCLGLVLLFVLFAKMCGPVGSENSDNRAPGSETYKVHVAAQSQWVDTGIDLAEGQLVEVFGAGRVRTTDTVNGSFDPSGGAGQCNHECSYPQGTFGQLVGRIGAHGRVFLVGKHLKLHAGDQGRLYLAVNDCCDWADNSGHFTAAIRVRQ